MPKKSVPAADAPAARSVAASPIVSSAHLVSPQSAELSEFEFAAGGVLEPRQIRRVLDELVEGAGRCCHVDRILRRHPPAVTPNGGTVPRCRR